MKRFGLLLAMVASLGLTACDEPRSQNRGVYMLMDTSGTYTDELRKAQQIINAMLTRLDPGDSFAVARIDTGSFSEKDIVAKVTFDDRPSLANKEKRQFRDIVGQFVKTVKPARHTDITGGLLQASEYLNEKNPGRKTIIIFSDLAEDLKKGYVRDIALPLDGFDVVALNVTKLRTDNIDPREYLNRLTDWQQKIESGGGQWRVINDLDRLEKLLSN
jgi:hypothetical protein